MQPLLYLVHRIPYPPNKGDKIRSFNILKYLSQFYDIYLGCFLDDPEDIQYIDTVAKYCKQNHIETINPKISKIKSLHGLFSGQALSIPYYRSATMQQWVDDVINKNTIKLALAFSSPMAQFIEKHDALRRIMDFVDIDSDKWQQYTQSHQGLMNLVYKREAKFLFQYEKKIATQFDASIFVSNKEAEHFKKLIGKKTDKVVGISNGVDFDYFNPTIEFDSPYNPKDKVLVFTGAMDYWANCDAVIWFATEVFPILYKKNKTYRFFIVGSNPIKEVLKLSQLQGIEVTGRVDDIRPYLKHAYLSVAPLRIARGIQNKVLEAMAMNKVVVVTKNAIEGIEINPEIEQNIANSSAEQVECVLRLNVAQNDNSISMKQLGINYGKWIRQKYNWKSVLVPLKNIIDNTKEL